MSFGHTKCEFPQTSMKKCCPALYSSCTYINRFSITEIYFCRMIYLYISLQYNLERKSYCRNLMYSIYNEQKLCCECLMTVCITQFTQLPTVPISAGHSQYSGFVPRPTRRAAQTKTCPSCISFLHNVLPTQQTVNKLRMFRKCYTSPCQLKDSVTLTRVGVNVQEQVPLLQVRLQFSERNEAD